MDYRVSQLYLYTFLQTIYKYETINYDNNPITTLKCILNKSSQEHIMSDIVKHLK